MQREQHRTEHLLDHEQMPDVATAEVGAGPAGALRIKGALIALVGEVSQLDRAAAGEGGGVAGVAPPGHMFVAAVLMVGNELAVFGHIDRGPERPSPSSQ